MNNPDLQQIKRQVGDLKSDLCFGEARKLLETAHIQYPQEVWIIQQLALCTYKDEELYPQHRLDKALELLESIGLRDSTNTNAETLALGGAVYKRMWEFSGQLEELYESLAFYRAANERNPQQDMGYGANNAAYILDLLAARAESMEKRNGLISREAPGFRAEARALRTRGPGNFIRPSGQSRFCGAILVLGDARRGLLWLGRVSASRRLAGQGASSTGCDRMAIADHFPAVGWVGEATTYRCACREPASRNNGMPPGKRCNTCLAMKPPKP